MEDEHSIEDMADRHARKHGRKPGITDAEREERNAEMIRDRLRGQTWEHLAEKYGIRARECQRIYNAWREGTQATYQGRDPIQIVHGMLDRLEAWIGQLADVADDATVDSTKVAAINAQLAMLTRTAELLQATNLLPHDLGTLRLELDIQTLAVRLVTVLTEHGAPPEMKRAILETLRADAVRQPELSNGTG